MNMIGNVLAGVGFAYAGVLMVTCMVKSVHDILSPQEEEAEKQKKKAYHVVKVKMNSRNTRN